VGGLVALVAASALVFFVLRRRSHNERAGPGSGSGSSSLNGGKYNYISAPKPGPGTGFAAVNQDADAYEANYAPPMINAQGQQRQHGSPLAAAALPTTLGSPENHYPPVVDFSANNYDGANGQPSPYAYMGAAGVGPGMQGQGQQGTANAHNSYPPAEGVYHYPGQYPAAYASGGSLSMYSNTNDNARGMQPDEVPLTREIDDFSHGFHQALGRIEEDEERTTYRGADGRLNELPVNDGNGVTGPSAGPIGTAVSDDNGGPGAGANNDGYPALPPRSSSGMRPLWQQNRRQSRNLMWM